MAWNDTNDDWRGAIGAVPKKERFKLSVSEKMMVKWGKEAVLATRTSKKRIEDVVRFTVDKMMKKVNGKT